MKYISLYQYMKTYKVGYNVALQLLHSGKLEYIKTKAGWYKIAVYSNDDKFISLEQYEKIIKENEKLKTIIRNISNISKEVLDV